jgi:hypothetical protein
MEGVWRSGGTVNALIVRSQMNITVDNLCMNNAQESSKPAWTLWRRKKSVAVAGKPTSDPREEKQ